MECRLNAMQYKVIEIAESNDVPNACTYGKDYGNAASDSF